MQKVFKSCYPLDKRCYEVFELTEDILMEHAARGIAEYIRNKFDKGSSVLIVAGVGNNGADGSVLARQLHGDFDVKLVLPFWCEIRDGKTSRARELEAVGVQFVH